ncbi:hypothetical protein CBM2634_U150011 [Cupriavidus taiwanensis]|uniref:Uncharacterized protein n=1 Tax=Cupriavidus taiwanensis TaxID=164546 RepID=A0A375JCB8_9BURK|nr:hypothetical protein CBM2634_U150011 [Cupriavidus taiwanensis]
MKIGFWGLRDKGSQGISPRTMIATTLLVQALAAHTPEVVAADGHDAFAQTTSNRAIAEKGEP